jgi:hypothetical protein
VFALDALDDALPACVVAVSAAELADDAALPAALALDCALLADADAAFALFCAAIFSVTSVTRIDATRTDIPASVFWLRNPKRSQTVSGVHAATPADAVSENSPTISVTPPPVTLVVNTPDHPASA